MVDIMGQCFVLLEDCWEDFDVEIIGVDIEAINITEDRDRFKKLLKTIEIFFYY